MINLNYMMSHIPYQISKTTLSYSLNDSIMNGRVYCHRFIINIKCYID